jgi:hypothetical protein
MFIVIERGHGWRYATVVTDEDGENKIFDTLEEAQAEADECQDGIVVGDEVISDETNELVTRILSFLDNIGADYIATDTTELEIIKKNLKSWLSQVQ